MCVEYIKLRQKVRDVHSMTIEDAKEYISSIVDTYEICHDAKHTSVAVSIGVEDAKALEMAIASLEALEEIRQEAVDTIEDGLYVRNSRILDIIDKHMGEKE